MLQNEFKTEVKELRKKHGRSMTWIIEKFKKYTRNDFYTLLEHDKFSEAEKEAIRKTIKAYK